MTNAQAKLEVMKHWAPERLAARLPAWARPSATYIKPFAPDLRQFIPRGPVTVLSNERHRTWVFEYQFKVRGDSVTEYVRNWNTANNYA